ADIVESRVEAADVPARAQAEVHLQASGRTDIPLPQPDHQAVEIASIGLCQFEVDAGPSLGDPPAAGIDQSFELAAETRLFDAQVADLPASALAQQVQIQLHAAARRPADVHRPGQHLAGAQDGSGADRQAP